MVHAAGRRLLLADQHVAGPILGFALIFTYLPLLLINAIGAIVFALLIPYVAIGQTLLYFDLQARASRRRRSAGGALPRPRAKRRAARFGAVKLLAFSDLHRDLGQAAELVEMSAEADVVIGAGDFASVHEGLGGDDRRLAAIETPTVLVPGNNETEEALREAASGWSAATVLHGEGTTIDGVEFYGLGAGVPVDALGVELRPRRGGGGGDARRLPARARSSSSTRPPQGHCDANGGGDHFGSEALLRAIEEKRPRLAVCGHIHESWGCESRIGETPLRNLGPKGTWIEV